MENLSQDYHGPSVYDNSFIRQVLGKRRSVKEQLAGLSITNMDESLLRSSCKSPREGMRDLKALLNKKK